jgi:hypothetical protein
MRDIDLMLADIVPRLAGLAPTLTHEIVRHAVEPALLEARLLRPFIQATKLSSRSSLPPWAIEVVRDTIDDYIEKGAEHFDAELNPPAKP